jgi:hypothetical protein
MSKKTKAKPFKNWLHEDVVDEFGLKLIRTHPFLEVLDKIEPISQQYTDYKQVEGLREGLSLYAETWNEDELKTMFVNPFLSLLHLISPYYKVFAQRPISLCYANDTLLTESPVDFILGKGIQTMKKPFYLLNKYIAENPPKKGQVIIQDIGHLLVAMVASQKMNTDQKPIYGIYVVGRNWFFVILDGSEYAVSKSYSAEDDEIFKIFAMLLHIKSVIEKLYQEI